MAFRFSLETVLKHRKRQEEVAHREVVEAQTRLEICLQGIDLMYQQIDDARVAVSNAERSGRRDDIQFICAFEAFIEGQKTRIHKERLHARELIRDVEDKQEALLERLHERKIIEKLKDRRMKEYEERIRKLEQKEMDDLTSARQRLMSVRGDQ